MKLDLTASIEKQLKAIVDDAIASGKIQTDQLRMIIISPNKTFDLLKVTYNNEWDKYYYESEYNDTGEIGFINIDSWLDIADRAFENREQISNEYIEKAKKFDHKYYKLKPILSFDHIQEEPYKSFLVCLRETLLQQISDAVSQVATSYDLNTFQHVVGFIANKLVFKKGGDDDNRIIAFNHPNGAGPFYKVMLSLPNYKLTYPYLKFYESGFHLFYPESNIYEGPNEESHIYTYDIDNFTYGFRQSKRRERAVFRLNDEFEDWELSGGHIEEEEGDFSEKEFYEAYNSFLSKFPNKNLDTDTIPDPIDRPKEFQKWLDIMVTNNLAITYDHKHSIYGYGEEAYKKALQLLPETHQSYISFKKFLSSKLYDQSRYEEALKVLKTIKNLSDHEKTHVLEILYFLEQREEFDTIYSNLENNSAKKDALLIKWLFDIKSYSSDPDKIFNLKTEITAYLDSKIDFDEANRARIALIKIYSLTNENEEARLLFTKLYHPSDRLMGLFLKISADNPFILNVYEDYLTKEEEKKNFELWLEKPTLTIPEIDKKEIDTVLFKDCYYPTHKIKDVNLKWAVPIAPYKFIAVNDDEQLFLGEITSSYEIIKHQVIQLDNDASYSYYYSDEIIYIAQYNKGIYRYSVQDNQISELKGIIKNKKAATRYKKIAASDGFLYACNDGYLEIFDLSDPTKDPISSELYIDSAFSLYVHNDVLVTIPSSQILVLIDIHDRTNPTYLSSIKDEQTCSNKHVEFIENYLIGGFVIDISDPKSPQYICHTWDEIAPTFYISEKPEISLYSTGDEHLFKTLVKDNDGKINVSNWLEYINKDNFYYERLTSNLATMYNGDTVIGYTPYDICILEKGKNPKYEKKKFDIQTILENMVFECFEYILHNHPDFRIGKVVLEKKRAMV
ncbi:hypothetical protein [Aquimarina sp. SS2-1]|uniref:hypothetical protein n=1 Tax=Aquimarina besae TaxID=3342247 RepID=UPI003672E433